MIDLILLIFIFILAIYLRTLPFHFSKNLGVDNWYWKLYIETYREKKEFPVKLNNYLLEIEEQWYPPLFPLLIANLPRKLVDKYFYLGAVGIDIVRMGVLCGIASVLTGNLWSVVFVGFIYALTPILIAYSIQLNPRGLGGLFLDIILILIWRKIEFGGDWQLIFVLLLSGLILLTHKMTTQLMWFLFLILGLWYRDGIYFALIPGSILVAFILSKGFYWKVLKAHWDIVGFWNRNWNWLGAHQFYDSLIYKKDGWKSPSLTHKYGINGFLEHLQRIIAHNPFVIAVPLIILMGESFYGIKKFIFIWITIIYSLTFLTTYIPNLKCLGAGYLYVFNGAFPIALFIGLSSKSWIFFSLLLLSLVLSICSLIIFYRRIKKMDPSRGVSDDLMIILNYLKILPKDNVICIPMQLPDAVAYFTKKKVFWGGHGYGFKFLEPYFPIMRKRIEEAIIDKKINYLLYYKKYLDDLTEIIPQQGFKIGKIKESGDYELYEVFL